MISMKITPLSLVAVLVPHLLWSLPLVVIFIHQVYLTPGGRQLSVRIKFLHAFTLFPTASLAVIASFTVISYMVSIFSISSLAVIASRERI